MKKTNNLKDTLFDYVTNTSKWFYWYHNPVRLEELYKQDHQEEPFYNVDECNFIKRPWRFKRKTVTLNKGDNVTSNESYSVVIEENLADFFDAVLDEVRLKKANDFAEYALYISDNEDLAYFRNTVAKREIIADIDYNSQRDHAVHTLYNYLLGWYIFEHSEKLQNAFQHHFEVELKILIDKPNEKLLASYDFGNPNNKTKIPDLSIASLVHEFADVWTIVSLLHDIGYILEGSLSSASPDVEHLRVTNGSKIIHDYFNHYFWKSFEVDFRVGKSIAKTLGVVVPDFRYSESLASLGDRLCDIGSCENLRKELKKINRFKTLNKNNKAIKDGEVVDYKVITEDYGLNREVFSIWKEHYKFHNKNKQMEDILYVVERVYKDMMWVGADYGKRNLDHGVCSGLITLQALTFFRELYWGFCQAEWDPEPRKKQELSFSKKQKKSLENTCDRVSHELFEQIRYEITRIPKRIRVIRGKFGPNDGSVQDKRHKLLPDFWFNKILWATAASAIHSIIQKSEYKKQCQKHINIKLEKVKELKRLAKLKNSEQYQEYLDGELKNLKIGFNDDPLAFLGVFIDVLQEWDRYKVTGRGEAAFSGAEPLQSSEVYLFCSSKNELKDFCAKNSLCLEQNLDKYQDNKVDKDNLIYLMYPAGGNEKKDWIKEFEKKMGYGLKGGIRKRGEGDWDTIVKIIAYYRENDELPYLSDEKTMGIDTKL